MEQELLLDKLSQLKHGLTTKATGGEYSNADYNSDKQALTQHQHLKKLLPSFVRTCRTVEEFWNFIQPLFPTYAQRRRYIQEELDPVFNYLDEMILDGGSEVLSQSVFELGEKIGYGGYGNVYLYHHKLLEMDFAIKILDPIFASNDEQKIAEKRFYREAKLLFNCSHENIVKVFDVGILGDKPFIRMELIEGGTFQDVINEHGTISFEASKRPIRAILKGLEYAHSKGIIHRDLKPTNIMRTKDREYKIIDFGISAFLDLSGHTKLTKTGESVIGGAYSDPVLVVNPRLRDVRSDIYSVAAVWYYLLIGRPPLGANIGKNLIEIGLADDQVTIILTCLSDDLNDRYTNCSELLSIIENL